MNLTETVKVRLAQVSRSTRSHQLVQSVDTLHVKHEAERRVHDNVRVAFHVIDHRLVESPHLVLTALLAVVLVRSIVVLQPAFTPVSVGQYREEKNPDLARIFGNIDR